MWYERDDVIFSRVDIHCQMKKVRSVFFALRNYFYVYRNVNVERTYVYKHDRVSSRIQN